AREHVMIIRPRPAGSCSLSRSSLVLCSSLCLFFPHTAPTAIYPLSLHDALPISRTAPPAGGSCRRASAPSPARSAPRCPRCPPRSEEHTSELQSRFDLVCRLLLEKKNNTHREGGGSAALAPGGAEVERTPRAAAR